MKAELHDYDIFPKVFPVGKEIKITVKPLGKHAEFQNPENMTVMIFGLNDGSPNDYPERHNGTEVAFEFDGSVHFSFTFPTEQRYFVRFFDKETDKRFLQLSVYALEEDLCGRYPFKGDLHMHSFRSDGGQAPEIVAANYRKYGYDFMALTDHRRYYPSLELIDSFKDVPIEMNLIPGEEVHMPKAPGFINDVHIVNFGSNFSVNALVEGSQNEEAGTDKKYRSYNGADCPDVMTVEQFRDEVCALAGKLDIPEGIERFAYACCVWEFEKIREGGGLGIFCHPYWISNLYQVPASFTDYMLETHPFDAFEVLGGEDYYEQNGFQTLKYYEMKSKGINFPIVGSTDTHQSFNSSKGFVAETMVFAPKNEKDSIISSIKDYYSVAIDTIGSDYKLVGDFRLSVYARFLLEDFFPLHDELCFEEGRAMKDYACGAEGAKETLEFISGRMKKQREKYFAF